MEKEPTGSVFKTPVGKIIIPLVIVIVIGAIWFLKNPAEQGNAINKNESGLSLSAKADFALHVTEKLDLEKLKSYGLPIVVDFGADSCIPCKEMAPVLVKLNEKYQGKAIVKFVDVWKYKSLAAGYPIRVIPTQVFIDKNGKPYVPSETQTIRMKKFYSQDKNEHIFTVHEGGLTEERLLSALKEMGMKE